MPELQTAPVGQTQRAEPQDVPATAANPLRTQSYAAGAAALAPRRRENLLTQTQERDAVRFNERRGFSRAKVKAYQNVVRTPDDGDFGPNTVEAIAAFQKSHALEIDGKIGRNTEHALEAEAAPDQNHDHEPKHDDTPVEGGGLTAHFSLAEFKSHDGRGFPKSVIPTLRELAENLEVLRAEVGPIGITSGYRSPQHNAAVGGAKNSFHMRGMAADITVGGMTPRQVKAAIERLISAGRMKQGGVGLYSGFVHYDIRGYASRW